MTIYEKVNELLEDEELDAAEVAATASLEAWRVALFFEGKLDGKNELAREAQARMLMEEKYEAVETCEAFARQAKHKLEMARLDVEMVRAQLRLAELVEAQAA